MKQQELIHYITQPQTLNLSQSEELERLLRQFPYFQTAHLLYTKGLHKNNPALYGKVLKKTAIVAGSRSQLYHLIHLPEPVSEAIIPEPEVLQLKPVVLETPVVPVQQERPVEKEEPQEEPKMSLAYTPPMFSTVTQSGINFDLSYLKALENREEPREEPKKEEAPELPKEKEPETLKPEEPAISKIQPATTKDIEKEIEKQIIASFVEKELLKIQDLYQPSTLEKKTEEPPVVKTPEPQENKKETVSPQEPHSFSEWLQALNKHKVKYQKPEETPVPEQQKPVQEQISETPQPQALPKNPKKENQYAIIDKIIDANPGHIRLQQNKFYTADAKAKESLLENEHLVTETLAKIYALQGNINKAIRAYEILSLKFPQKSAYFATLIDNLKKDKN